MSTIIHENDQFKVNVFYGGDERGPCLQITMQECRDPAGWRGRINHEYS